MRFSTKPRKRKHVQGYGFLSFVRKFAEKCGKKLMNTETKTGTDAAKLLLKELFKKCKSNRRFD